MLNFVDNVFTEVCLDERVTDGIFEMDNTEHMNALRDFFVKKGIPKESVIKVTNRMIEGKYPDRQAYRKEDGILVTWPSPQHKQKALTKNPGKYVEQDPFPDQSTNNNVNNKEEPSIQKGTSNAVKPSTNNTQSEEPQKVPNIFVGDKKLEVEPNKDVPAPPITASQAPLTPQKKAAEKELVKQLMGTDNTTNSLVTYPVCESIECKHQLQELYKKANELGLKEAVKFLTPFVQS